MYIMRRHCYFNLNVGYLPKVVEKVGFGSEKLFTSNFFFSLQLSLLILLVITFNPIELTGNISMKRFMPLGVIKTISQLPLAYEKLEEKIEV